MNLHLTAHLRVGSPHPKWRSISTQSSSLTKPGHGAAVTCLQNLIVIAALAVSLIGAVSMGAANLELDAYAYASYMDPETGLGDSDVQFDRRIAPASVNASASAGGASASGFVSASLVESYIPGQTYSVRLAAQFRATASASGDGNSSDGEGSISGSIDIVSGGNPVSILVSYNIGGEGGMPFQAVLLTGNRTILIGAGAAQVELVNGVGTLLISGGVAVSGNGSGSGSLTIDVHSSLTPITRPRLVALEVTQSIQDWYNSVPLITGKRTFARAFLEAVDAASVGKPVTGKLHGTTRNGSLLPGSPLSPVSGGGLQNPALLSVNAHAAREKEDSNLRTSLTFELPPSWCSDSITLEFVADGQPAELREPAEAGGTANDGKVGVTFQLGPRLRVIAVPMGLINSAGAVVVPAPSAQAAANVAHYARQMYPIDDIDLEIHAPAFFQKSPDTVTIDELLEQVKQVRKLDKVSNPQIFHLGVFANNVMSVQNTNYGVLGLADWVEKKCAWALPYPETTTPHELGHLLWQPHAVHASFGPTKEGDKQSTPLCTIAIADSDAPDFPLYDFVGFYPETKNKPLITLASSDANAWAFGFTRYLGAYSVKVPTHSFELMSYCEDENEAWISTYTYGVIRGVLEYLARTTSPFPAVAALSRAKSPPVQTYLLVRGIYSFMDGTVEWLPFQCLTSDSGQPEVEPGNFTLRLLDGTAAVTAELQFQISLAADNERGTTASFVQMLPFDPSARRIELWYQGTLMGALDATPNPPAIQVLTPAAGQTISTSEFAIQWQAHDADGDSLRCLVQYSADNGVSWRTLAADLSGTNLIVHTDTLPGSTQARVRVLASDGFHCRTAQNAGPFIVPDSQPVVSITSASGGTNYYADAPVVMDALAFDREDGLLKGASLEWRSDRDGLLGTGEFLNRAASTLSVGAHELSVTARDSQGHATTVTNRIFVFPFQQPSVRVIGGPENGAMLLELTGTPNTRLVFESSSNFLDWSEQWVLEQKFRTFEMTELLRSNEVARFFRVRTEALGAAIQSQPVSTAALAGTNLELSVAATGSLLHFQWFFNGTALAGATSSMLTLSNPQPVHSGIYWCLVSNLTGSVTSAPAHLTILGAPYEVLHHFGTNNFDGTNGWGSLIRASDGLLYGCALNGAISNGGVVFRMQVDGNGYNVLHRFQPASDGGNPLGGLIEAGDGMLYGTCSTGGTNAAGTIWRMSKDGSAFSILRHLLSSSDVRNPQAPLVQGSDGMLYGTAYNGGSLGRGGVFRLNRDGSGYQIISSFNFGGGSAPRGPLGGVVEGHDGRLYGTTEWGGSANKGTIFALKKDGAGAILVGSLGWAAGFVANPDGSLLQARDGFLYGTAYAGGASNLGGVFKISTNGSPFSVLRSFGQYAGDGVEPHAGLVAHPDGRLAGTTRMGGNFGAGTLFIGNTAGTTNLIQHHFAGMGGDGAHPRSPLLFVPGGVAYGMTFGGGSNDQGTVYRLWIP